MAYGSVVSARAVRWRRIGILLGTALFGLAVLVRSPRLAPWRAVVWQRLHRQHTVGDRLHQYEALVRGRLAPDLRRLGVEWPPSHVRLVAFKRERRLDAYVQVHGEWRRLHSYPVLAASGSLGPKLRAGDRQVPEGRYGVESLNPNSLYHLALRLEYPNAWDRARAAEDGRHELGGDIMIHGSDASSGCLAMGDPVSEDLFVLAAAAGPSRVEVVIVPFDLRGEPGWRPPSSLPVWSTALYADLSAVLRQLHD